MGYNLLPTLNNLVLKLFHICLVGARSGWPLCPFDTSKSFYFLAFWHHKMFGLNLYFLCPSSGISHFSGQPWFPK